MTDNSIQLHVDQGTLCVWVTMPASPQTMRIYRFDGQPLGLGFEGSTRDRAIARAMLSDAIEQLDRWDPTS